MSAGGERLDVTLVKRGLAPSRERAQAAIAAGLVRVNGAVCDKASTRLAEDAAIEVAGDPIPYVSRGGLKLAKALDYFAISPSGLVAMDIGASTGGFTDCMLQRGAARVYAVDVGHDQLAESIRQDPRVVVLERTNARHLTGAEIPEQVGFVTIDVSFISLDRLWPAIVPLLRPAATIIALVKPQFEAGPANVGRNGVVRSPRMHVSVLTAAALAAHNAGLAVRGMTFSPVRGPEGNIEFLMRLDNSGDGLGAGGIADLADATVRAAHASLA